MPVETHEVIFSFDQPGDARHPLLSILQQLLSRPLARDSRAAALLGARRVLIVDSQRERAQYIAQLLSSAGYWPFVAMSSLDAYTLFLQGSFLPFAIILCENSATNNQFFLTRLSQQFTQRYDWNVPFLRLQIPPSPLFAPRSTEPLAPSQQRLASQMTMPLNQRGIPSARHTTSAPLQPARNPAPPPDEQPFRTLARGQSPSAHQTQPGPAQTDPPLPGSRSQFSPSPPRTPVPSPLTPLPPGSLPASSEVITSRGPLAQRALSSLPSASMMRFDKKQTEKISLDGLSIGRYQLQSVIGGNPIGDVYLTYDRLREQDIALKTIQTNMIPFHLMEGLEEDYNLFQQELDLFQQLDHPHLSRVMNIGKSYISGFPFLYKTMPHYAEGSLAKWQGQFSGRPCAPSEVARVILQLAEALQFLHERGLLYQNFKMTNILVVNETRSMRDLHIVLADLPFVQDVINLPKTQESYRYVAPEQWENEAFTSSDQYGLAVIAYELLTGRTPFQGHSDILMRRMHLTMPAPPPSSFNPQIYPFIDKVILRALSKRPEDRFESVTAFASALERASN